MEKTIKKSHIFVKLQDNQKNFSIVENQFIKLPKFFAQRGLSKLVLKKVSYFKQAESKSLTNLQNIPIWKLFCVGVDLSSTHYIFLSIWIFDHVFDGLYFIIKSEPLN